MTEEKAREIAHGLIQGYIGPDHKVIDMRVLLGAHAGVEGRTAAVNAARLLPKI